MGSLARNPQTPFAPPLIVHITGRVSPGMGFSPEEAAKMLGVSQSRVSA
jgi:hypothetical protein